MNYSLTKKEIRTIYKEKRMALSQDEVNFLSEKIFNQFVLQFNVIENQKVNLFLPIKKFNEINTQIFIDYFFDKKVRVFVPKIQHKKMISVEIFPDSEFEINDWGIKEPISNIDVNDELDYVLTPLLYCDRFGNRVGYGKGFYDSFFAGDLKIHNKIGLGLFNPKEDIADVYGSDIALDGLITPTDYFKF
ncbi:5-formyltetrahydrofolate cyclo-ligase [Epilithonimonas arachidiradicis]|uniref:5-formyltetrahydrofolate cyclo-ligase n=1 Tax=Epilithonimonas arachidiradicis TaxID=1617282 RepID=A0A420D8J3_9FLAO|nr:5-formyltetrahydrofolate cyclo-ligase [Epilithonimonas arachidiradicis]RKE86884.1 5-formyltetrahydrofolate cyclo-ligase [Epilithonimonas arachidiradicis]GGG61336.1 5-formyltetrahydrofolate cyclo-ligase [Epilithonimonas arachidiradicis]